MELFQIPLSQVLEHAAIPIPQIFFNEIIPRLGANCICAGGFLRRLIMGDGEATDIDLWVTNSAFVFNPFPYLEGALDKKKCITTISHPSMEYKLQFIERQFNCANNILNNFDLTVCQLATDGISFYFSREAAEHLAAKIIVYNAAKVVRKRGRIKKYIDYGYLPFDEWALRVVAEASVNGWNVGDGCDYIEPVIEQLILENPMWVVPPSPWLPKQPPLPDFHSESLNKRNNDAPDF